MVSKAFIELSNWKYAVDLDANYNNGTMGAPSQHPVVPPGTWWYHRATESGVVHHHGIFTKNFSHERCSNLSGEQLYNRTFPTKVPRYCCAMVPSGVGMALPAQHCRAVVGAVP